MTSNVDAHVSTMQLGAGTDAFAIASRIVSLVSRFRRMSVEALCANQSCQRCEAPHLATAERIIARGERLEFALPGFPAKSPNLRKVLGIFPDEAERRALLFLDDLCRQIQTIYEPGARVLICSDGRVFGDYVGIEDEHITAYQDRLAEMLSPFETLSAFNLDDKWSGLSFDVMRDLLTEQYADGEEETRRAVKEDDDTRRLYLGMSRFLFEDQKGRFDESNRTLQNRAKERAYGVIRRSKAWGKLVSEQFPDALRLSIHPQACGSAKMGIRLGTTPDAWLTPWHSAAVKIGDGFQLMKRHEAEAAGARVVQVRGENSYLTFDDVAY